MFLHVNTILHVLLVFLFVNGPASVQAIGKETTHCEAGFCLFLAPGSRVGVLKPAQALGQGLTQSAGRRLLQDIPVTPVHLQEKSFLRVYFPSMPRSGSLHLRKLWEAATTVVSERASVGPGLTLSARSGAFAPQCGGIPVTAKDESHIVEVSDPQCAQIRPGMGNDPVLIKSNEPSEFVGPVFKETADVILLLVRNPVDAYQSLFQYRNARYMHTQDANDLEWRLTFDQFLSSIWEAYITHFDDAKVPRVVIRYEDLHSHPDTLIKEVLTFTGVAASRQMNNDAITAAIKQLQADTKHLRPKNAVGEGFKVLMSLDEKDQEFALKVLDKYNATLKALGYFYYRKSDGIPPSYSSLVKEQENLEKTRIEELNKVGLIPADMGEVNNDASFVLLPGGFSSEGGHSGNTVLFIGVCAIIAVGYLVWDKYYAGKEGRISLLDTAISYMTTSGNSFKARMQEALNRKAPHGHSQKAGSRILEEAKTVMSQSAESPAAKLARLKSLRDKLASVRN